MICSVCEVISIYMFILTNYFYAFNSERAAKTGAEGTRLEEGGKINRSLMHLGTVIRGKNFCVHSHQY